MSEIIPWFYSGYGSPHEYRGHTEIRNFIASLDNRAKMFECSLLSLLMRDLKNIDLTHSIRMPYILKPAVTPSGTDTPVGRIARTAHDFEADGSWTSFYHYPDESLYLVFQRETDAVKFMLCLEN